MRHPLLLIACAVSIGALAACDSTGNTVERKIQDVNVIDESNLNDVMMTVADPNEAVSYFRRALQSEPDRLDLKRGLAKSQVRAQLPKDAAQTWASVVSDDASTHDDRVELADALIRSNEWDKAEGVLDSIPPTYETYRRYRLEAMIADSNEEWDKADSFYETAVGLTTTPASVFNNWGYSKLTRGDFAGAEQLFTRAVRQDPSLFTAKNNLVLARGAQGNYTLPVLPLSQIERAQLLHSLGLTAVKRGDVVTARGLFGEALEAHPQHFEAAARSLEALEANVAN